MDKEQINKKLEEVINDVMPDIEDINMTSSIVDIYGVKMIRQIYFPPQQ